MIKEPSASVQTLKGILFAEKARLFRQIGEFFPNGFKDEGGLGVVDRSAPKASGLRPQAETQALSVLEPL